MNFNRHSDLVGQHAFLSASKYHWVNYDVDKLVYSFSRHLATQKGIELHDLACRCIELKVKLPKSKRSLNTYVNDAIGFRMHPEQPLFYSVNAFGTADTICFRDDVLRIHDLKTGVTSVSMQQLEIYSALFCLEYDVDPKDIKIELRIYQLDEMVIQHPEPKDIRQIMEKIVLFDKQIEKLKTEMED